MKLVQVVTHVGNLASGPSYSCVRLSEELGALGHDVVLASLGDKHSARGNGRFRHKVFATSKFPPGLCRSPELSTYLDLVIPDADIVHNHGLWLMPNVYSGWSAGRASKPLVISTRGTLSRYAFSRSRIKKALFWWALQRDVVNQSAMIHATSEQEYIDVRSHGFKQPVCIVPNGIDIPALHYPDTPRQSRTLLFLARLHPTKRVEVLLRAWAILESRFVDWDLDIVGPDSGGYLKKMRRLSAELGLERVRFVGPLFGTDKQDAFRGAELYVLPTHSENFGITVAESLAAGTPVVVTKGAPWQGLETHKCGWWIDHGVSPLTVCLEHALSLSSSELRAKGQRGREWVSKEFSWMRVARDMVGAYSWIQGRQPQPEYVKVD